MAADVEVRVVRIACSLTFRASARRVFSAVTTDTARWFPATYGEDRVRRIVVEPEVGGRFHEDWGGAAGHLYGIVQQWDPPRLLTVRGWLHLGVTLDSTFAVAEADGVSTLTVDRVAVGPMTAADEAAVRAHGDLANFEEPLRAWLERAV